jgi:hypothetical protein
MSFNREETFTIRFVEAPPKILLELTNTTDKPLKCVEVLSIFLKDEDTPGSPSRAHIKFDAVSVIQSKEKALLSHRTWIDGRPADDPTQDLLARLQAMPGETKPYVLDISWQDVEGKTRFQRIAVGH